MDGKTFIAGTSNLNRVVRGVSVMPDKTQNEPSFQPPLHALLVPVVPIFAFIGLEIAKGLISGSASWAIGRLWTHLFGDNTVEAIKAALREAMEDLLRRLPAVIRPLLDANQTEQLEALAASAVEKLGVGLSGSSLGFIEACWREVQIARHQTSTLDDPVKAYEIFFILLPVEIGICDHMLLRNPSAIGVDHREFIRTWRDRGGIGIADGDSRIAAVRQILMEKTHSRVSARPIVPPSNPTATPSQFAILVDGREIARHPSTAIAEELRRVRKRLYEEVAAVVIYPAEAIIRELRKFNTVQDADPLIPIHPFD